MKKIRYGLIALSMLLCSGAYAETQLSIGIGLPNLSIGINLPVYPELVPVPGNPVYYAPQVNGNYFFYDGMYWVYQDDNWYASSWYNGPWSFVEPMSVPLFVLRIPVRYYQQPPVYFRGWQTNAPPRWGQHWGHDWQQRRHGWDKWNRSSVPSRAPRPVYQRQYSGDRYPQAEQQHNIRGQQYRHHPRDKAVRQHLNQERGQRAPAQSQQGRPQAPSASPQHGNHQSPPAGYNSPQPRQNPGQREPESREQRQQQGDQQHREQQEQKLRSQGHEKRQDRGESQNQNRGHGQGQGKEKEGGRAHDN